MPITFYATVDADSVRSYMPDVPVLLPASSFARHGLRPPKLPAQVTRAAADSGGFVATFKWGDYRYSPEEYVRWLSTWTPEWAATMDYCCEPEVLGKSGIVRERQERTTRMAEHFWEHYRDAPWAWVPTVQGWEVEDYRRHARECAPLFREMAAHYGKESAFRVGIGTLCRQASSEMIRRVALTVAAELPGIPLHLWGIKLGALRAPLALPDTVVSVDSAAWHFPEGGYTGDWRWKEWAALHGKSRRQYEYEVALPRYQALIDAALVTPRQALLF